MRSRKISRFHVILSGVCASRTRSTNAAEEPAPSEAEGIPSPLALPAASQGVPTGIGAASGRTRSSVLHNRRKGLGIERRPAHQRAIDFLLRHQSRGIVRLHRSSVENAQLRRELFAKYFRSFPPDYCMSLGRLLRSSCLPRANRPHRLIGYDELRSFLGGDRMESPHTLPPQHVVGESGL